MPKLIIDGQEIEVPAHYTVLQACEAAGVEVPRFCFHERLSVAGNCRMCLVEIKGGPPKPQASCAIGVRDLRPGPNGEPPVVNTTTPMVKKAREGVMEFLLINHPLDCPICDQGGECDLQDQAMAYGVDNSRYAENKRAVEDKYIGPLVKTTMTRCIHCTRCVRFTQEVAGVGDLGAIGRGEDMEITTYLEAAMASEMQGNVVDLCPVGALTSRPYQNKSRPWELSKTETIDVMDAMGANIRVDSRGKEVMRILPRVNEAINEEWISDKTRHVADGLKTQRLDRPYVRENGRLREATWAEAFSAIAKSIKAAKPEAIGAIGGALAGVEELYALKMLLNALGSTSHDMQGRGGLNPSYGRASYLFNSTIEGVEQADAIMMIGTNPRREAPVLNARMRKRWSRGGLLAGVIGPKVDLTYDHNYLGDKVEVLTKFASHKPANKETPMMVIGAGVFNRPDGAGMMAAAAQAATALGVIKDGWNGFNVLHTDASMVGALDIGFVPEKGGLDLAAMLKGKAEVIFNLGADEITIPAGPFVIYQGTHGDRGAERADVVLPGAAYTEKSVTYVNMEGRPQMTERAVFPPGDAREDWAIFRALSETLKSTLPFDSLSQLRKALYAAHPNLAALEQIQTANPDAIVKLAKSTAKVSDTPIGQAFSDFYLTNPVARASAIMAECSRRANGDVAMAAE
jgi:NADH-quinone oxidoreductase subunit G